ncbi:MAG: tetratricopeptide repeat protein, partial [Desulfocucumaceae bacterium]
GPPADAYYFEDGAGLTELKSELWSKLGWAYYLNSNYNDARESFESAIKLSGRNHRALNGLGWTLMQKGLQNSAVTNFDAALMYIAPGDRDSIQEITRGRGWAYLHGGSWQKAVQDFDRAIGSCDPSNMAVLRELNRGKSIALLKLGKIQEAMECAALAGESSGGYRALIRIRVKILYMFIKKVVNKLLG